MKITISKRDLESAIQVAAICVSSSEDLSGHFLFRVRDGKVEVLAYNGRLFAEGPLNCQYEGDEGEAFTVESWRLRKWLGAVGDVAITLESEEALITATSPRGSVKWSGLDPDKFPLWDDIVSNSKEIASIESSRLHSALSYVKQFTSEESKMPHLALTEIRSPKEGVPSALYATDQVGVAVVQIADMEKSTLRVHGQDTAPLLSFLASNGSSKVVVWEHDNCLLIKREDGFLFGVTRPRDAFPPLDMSNELDETTWWEVDTGELENVIRFLMPSAAKDDTRMKFRFDDKKQSVVASVVSSSGGADELPVKTVGFEGMDQLPDTGFMLRHPYLTKVMNQFDEGTLRFGIFMKQKGGWVRFQHEKDGDKYLTVVVWVI